MLTYEESARLMNDQIFRDRTKVACLNFARYITDEASSTPGHSTRIKWAQSTLVQPDNAVIQVTPTTVMDTAVQSAVLDAEGHSTITDADLQVAVETSVNKLL